MVGTLMVSACSSGPGTVYKKDVESFIVDKLVGTGGVKPDTATCPNDLEATVGAKVTCTVTLAGQSSPADVVVTEVTGGVAKFNVTGR